MAHRSRNRTLVVLLALLALAVSVASQFSGGAKATAAAPGPAPVAPIGLDVSAATTLRAALARLAPSFEKANNARLVFNFGASGVLQKQVEGGAPCDVFASASPKQVDALIAAGIVSADTTATFASNDLVIIVPAGNPTAVTGPSDLVRARRLVTGNPDTAPHGTKAKEFLTRLGTWGALRPRLVFAQNAAQTVDYVARGEVDAGLVFASEALGNDSVEVVYTVPADAVSPALYVAASTRASAQSNLAEKFVAYLLSPEAQAILAESGFEPAPTPAP